MEFFLARCGEDILFVNLAFLVEFVVELAGTEMDMEVVDFDTVLFLEGAVMLSQVTARSDSIEYPFLEFDGGCEKLLTLVFVEFRDLPDVTLGDDQEVSWHQARTTRDDHDGITIPDDPIPFAIEITERTVHNC